MKTIRLTLTSLLWLILFFSSCMKENEDEEDYSLRVKTVVSICVIHEGVQVGEGVFLHIMMHETDKNGLVSILVQENITTDGSGCISRVTPYHDFCNACTFHFYTVLPDFDVVGSNVDLTFEQASEGAVKSDDGHGRIYTWNITLVLSY